MQRSPAYNSKQNHRTSAQALRGNSAQGWKKNEQKRQWRSVLVVFIAVVLTFASVNGFLKTYAAGKAIAKSKWDGASSFALSLSDTRHSVFVFQKDPKRAAVLSSAVENLPALDGKEIQKRLTVAFGAPIESYVKFKDESLKDNEKIRSMYESFTSFATPIKLLTGGWGSVSLDTNVSRIDAFKLWWQLKSISVKSLTFADLSADADSKNSSVKKVLAAETDTLNRQISKYLENINISKEGYRVDIINSSDNGSAVALAIHFINSVGGKVGSVTGDVSTVDRCRLQTAKSSYTSNYLAKLFDCDINYAPEGANEEQITLTIGTDFAQKYFGGSQ